ncbi:enoyl-CoA delta isomerase 2, peroxisomal-like [Mizuhopecten yessoensis]|uniref:3-hydroxybutyryl-CoA dehydratase n=1 Tax=Mizuhopecten yessoensis TaxID=6573 RepID=A0A210R227_MIZYE|nr:enoyl-CoA delta isomerase 2, peroxisomal-like [Mizuhopecten yessoensis]OWF55133.1 3-hydroxybutyryl-CoA dehydratase [Mizuhopecten yessoensis]
MPVVRVEYTEDGIAIITMQNGENRLNQIFVTEMWNILDEIERNKDVKAVITTGEGKFYSNGLDLPWMKSETDDVVKKFRESLQKVQWRIRHFSLPTVAAINGHAFAGGAFLAKSHDYCVMNSKRGWISWNEIHKKMSMPRSGFEILRLKIDRMDAMREAVLFGKMIPATRAKELGIVDEAVEPANLLNTAKQIALRALGPSGMDRDMLQTMKKDLYPQTSSNSVIAKL